MIDNNVGLEQDKTLDLNSFPKEILLHIIYYMTDKSKRYLRLANTLWFELINYRDFTIYSADETTLPRIVSRLLKYDGTIGLAFKKSKIRDHMAHVSRLTHLTSLDLPTLDSSIWQNITVLTNLKNCPFSYAYSASPVVLASLVNLTEIRIPNYKAVQLIEALKKMSNLQSIRVSSNHDRFLDLYSLLPCPSRLTHLDIHGKMDHSNTTKFYNVKSLDYTNEWDMPVQVSLDKFTALERLALSQASSHAFGDLPTQLKSLMLWEKYLNIVALTRLHQLKELSMLRIDADDDQLAWIGGLTALRALNLKAISEPEKTFCGEFLRHIKSNQLTKLIIYLDANFDTDHLTHLTSLRILRVHEECETLFNYNFISNLTRLKEIYVRTHSASPLVGLTALHELKFMEIWPCYGGELIGFPEISLASLTKLEHAAIAENSRVTLESLSALKHLTFLHVTKLDPDVDYSFLSELPLQQLTCNAQVPVPESFSKAMARLPDLQMLEISHLNTAQVLGLSSLQNLTRLYMRSCAVGVDGANLTRLTSVQALNIEVNTFIPLNESEIKRRLPNLYHLEVRNYICEPGYY